MIGSWFVTEYFTYILVVGNQGVHFLPWHVPDRLFLREIAYQTTYSGAYAKCASNQKRTWPKLPIRVGRFVINHGPHAYKEADELISLHLCVGPFRSFDPNGNINRLYSSVNLGSYAHKEDLEENKLGYLLDYDLFLQSLDNPQKVA